MAGHYPFTGRGVRYGGARMTIAAFFEQHGLNNELQEKYYKWWYDWAKKFVQNDADLKVTKGVAFDHYPLGQHSHHSFHLNEKQWCTIMADLGDLVRDIIFPKMDDTAMHQLEEEHKKLLSQLEGEAKDKPREPAPDVGYFRHM
jgi:hypothetical protein